MQWFALARRLFVAGHAVDNPHGELSVLEEERLTLNELTFVSTNDTTSGNGRQESSAFHPTVEEVRIRCRRWETIENLDPMRVDLCNTSLHVK